MSKTKMNRMLKIVLNNKNNCYSLESLIIYCRVKNSINIWCSDDDFKNND